jgi:hypothetical protein
MERVAGSQWRTPAGGGIPRSDDSNVWYFIVAVDGNGNFDRLPEIDEGAYQYFQAPEDPCDTTPNAPALSGSYTSSTVDLAWTTPTTNADPAGWEYLDGAGFEIWRQEDGGGWSLIDTVTDPDATTYTDSPGDMGNKVYEYYVTAYDQCTDPAPNVSVASNIYTELEEDPCGTTPEGPVLTGVTGASSVDLTWTGPALNTSGTPYTDGAGFLVYRQRNLDVATRELLATLPPGDSTYSDSPPLGDLVTADYYYTVIAFDSCSPAKAGVSNVYVDQATLENPCLTTPNPPQNLTGVADYSDVTISWTPPATNATPAGTPYIDAGGYEVWRWDDLPVPGHRIWILVATISDPSTLEYTESPPDIGTIEYHYTVKAFDTCSPSPNVSNWHIPVYYEYVQDPCASIPTAPTLSGNLDAAPYVNLTWARPTGPENDDLAGYEIWRDKDGAGYALVHTISNPDTVAWQDTAVAGDIRYAEYSYQIRSFDLCATPNYSGYSDPWTETFVYDPCSPAPTAPAFPPSPPLQSSSVTPACPGDDSQVNSVTLAWPEATATVGEDILYEVWRCRSSSKFDACNPLDNPGTDTWELLVGGLTDTQRTWTDTLPFNSPKWDVFKGPNYKYSYQVKAVNTTCGTQSPQPSAFSIVYAPCN